VQLLGWPKSLTELKRFFQIMKSIRMEFTWQDCFIKAYIKRWWWMTIFLALPMDNFMEHNQLEAMKYG
jgi:hypothetical protein